MNIELRDDAKQWMIDQCERSGLKLTGPREIILDVIIESDDHPDVEIIHARASEQDKRISLATVYRTVKSFTEIGIITRHDFGDSRARYEVLMRRHQNNLIDHHDHLIDIDSGDVIEFYDEEIETLKNAIAEKLGYRLTGHRLELFGQKK